jgi:putative peptidoglycan lipid II flippase
VQKKRERKQEVRVEISNLTARRFPKHFGFSSYTVNGMNHKQLILRSSIVVAFFNLLGGLSAILVETSIADKLGLSVQSDTFYVAYTIPYIITNLLTITSQFSLVPFFSSLESNGDKDEVWRGFSYVSNILFLGLGAIAVVGAAGSPWIIHGIAPGFTRQQDALATQLSRWLFLIIIPAGIGEVQRSFLLSRHYFALPTALGFIRNVASIVIILLGFHRYGPQSIFMGYMAGYLLQLVILGLQIAVSFRPRYFFLLKATGESFSNLRGAGTAQIAGALGWQGLVVAERIIASFLPAGTLTALNYGFRILGTLAELLGGSVGTAALPILSRAVTSGSREEEYKTFRDTLEISLLLLTPVAVFCLMLPHNVIRLVFQRGQFTSGATGLMTIIFFYYSLSLLPYAFIRLLCFSLFARREPGVYVRLSLFHYGLILSFDLLFVGVLRMGAKGIPLGFLAGSLIVAGLAIRRNLGDLDATMDRVLGRFVLKNLGAALSSALSIVALQYWLPRPESATQDFIFLCLTCGLGGIIYLATLAALRGLSISQLAMLWSRTSTSSSNLESL